MLLISLLTSLPSFAQMVPQWSNNFCRPFFREATPHKMVIDDSNNIYVTNQIAFNTGRHTDTDPVIYKLNNSGKLLWYKNLGNNPDNEEWPFDLQIDDQRNLYFLHGQIINNAELQRITLTKLNSNGNTLWSTHFAQNNGYRTYKLRVKKNQVSYAVTDNLNRIYKVSPSGKVIDAIMIPIDNTPSTIENFNFVNDNNVSVLSRAGSGTSEKIYLSLIDSLHNILWTRTFDFPGYFSDISSGEDSSIYFSFYRPEPNNGYNLCLYKFDVSGNLVWNKEIIGPSTIGNLHSDYPTAPTKLFFSNDNTLTIFGETHQMTPPFREIFAAANLSSLNGEILWSYKNESAKFRRASMDSLGNFYVACYNYSQLSLYDTYLILKITQTGSLIRITKNNGLLNNIYLPYAIGINTFNDVVLNGAITNTGLDESLTIKYSQPVNITSNENSLPHNFSLSQNYPNPFNPSTTINFQIPKSNFVSLKVFDINGRMVSELVNENLKAGEYKINFDGSTLPSGVYYYKLTSGSFADTKKMVLIK